MKMRKLKERERASEGQLLTLDEVCQKLKISKKDIKNHTITYDYRGHILPQISQNLNKFPRQNSELSIRIKPDGKFSSLNIKNIKKQKLLHNNSLLCKVSDIKLAHLQINPSYGVVYSSNGYINNGPNFNDSPICKDFMSLKKYRELCSDGKNYDVGNDINNSNKQKIGYLLNHKSKSSLKTIDKSNSLSSLLKDRKKGELSQLQLKVDKLLSKSIEYNSFNNKGKRINTHNRLRRFSPLRIREYLCAERHYTKLPPPPLGSSLGHGLFLES